MRSRAIVRELVKQLMQADADQEHHKRMRKILKIRNYPDEDDDDPIDADPMRTHTRPPSVSTNFLATGRLGPISRSVQRVERTYDRRTKY